MTLWNERVEHDQLAWTGARVAGLDHRSKLVEEKHMGIGEFHPPRGGKVEYLW